MEAGFTARGRGGTLAAGEGVEGKVISATSLRIARYAAVLLLLLGFVGLAMGTVFIGQGVEKTNWMSSAMRVEKVTLGLPEAAVAQGEVIDTGGEAQAAADTIREHRRNIAPTYSALLGGAKYDPTKPEQLTYAQALNMENYLYLAVLGFGVAQIAIAAGAFMVVMGFAAGATGVALFALTNGNA
ncbi:MAG: hypothetical protein ABIH46_03165 [Chloroflexota bacterium]